MKSQAIIYNNINFMNKNIIGDGNIYNDMNLKTKILKENEHLLSVY